MTKGQLFEYFTTTEGIPVNFVSPSDEDAPAAFVRTVRAQGAPFNSASVIAQFLSVRTRRASRCPSPDGRAGRRQRP